MISNVNHGHQASVFLRYAIVFLALFAMAPHTGFAQMVIKEVDAVYLSEEDGRIISDEEFQSYRGQHTFKRHIRGKNGAKDTIVIRVPEKIKEDYLKQKFKAQAGKPHTPFSVIDIHGNPIRSDQLKGKVVVLNFWFVACPPCIQEIPHLNDLVAQYKGQEVVFLAIARDSEALLGKFLGHTSFDYQVIPNATAVARKNRVYAYPSHMVIDRNGVVQYTATGYRENSIKELQKAIEKAINPS